MRAVVVNTPGGPHNLIIQEQAMPSYSDDQLLVKVAACGINRADCLQRRGLYPSPPGESPILGLEVAGEVYAVGSQVQGFQRGDRICALITGGGYAEYCVVQPELAFHLPPTMNWITAAAIPETFLTAYACLFQIAALKPKERVLIHAGASGVGTTAIQLALAQGATVYATAGSAKKIEFLQQFDIVAYDYSEPEVWEKLGAATQGQGFDVILDLIGAKYLDQHLQYLATEGRLCFVSLISGYQTSIDLRPVLAKRLTLRGFTLRSQSLTAKQQLINQFKASWWSAICDGTLKPIIDQCFLFEAAHLAHEYLEERLNQGKCVLILEENI